MRVLHVDAPAGLVVGEINSELVKTTRLLNFTGLAKRRGEGMS